MIVVPRFRVVLSQGALVPHTSRYCVRELSASLSAPVPPSIPPSIVFLGFALSFGDLLLSDFPGWKLRTRWTMPREGSEQLLILSGSNPTGEPGSWRQACS